MAFPIRFLIDECLSPKLAEVANSGGIEITHVNFRALAGASDRQLARWCVDHDHAMVTNNSRDFRVIYGRIDVHPGLVIILPSVAAPEQVHLFRLWLATLGPEPDLINRLIEIDADGRVTISELP